MESKRSLERRLADLAGFDDPRVDLEQYPTPPSIAAHLIHLADLYGDLESIVVDLGAGTGVLALAAAHRGAARVVGIERDATALAVARKNEHLLEPPKPVDWVLADAACAPLGVTGATVVMNPPFGAQAGQTHADRGFLETAARIAGVAYSIHNTGSREFIESYLVDTRGTITHSFEARLKLDRQFPFHSADRTEIDAEVYRIEWPQSRPG